MDIMELGAIGELVGGVAVIASLVYVGLQVRQNTVTMRAASHHAITELFNTVNLSFGQGVGVSRVMRLGLEGKENLDEDGPTRAGRCVTMDLLVERSRFEHHGTRGDWRAGGWNRSDRVFDLRRRASPAELELAESERG